MGLPNNLGKLSNMITSTGSAVGVNTTTPFGIFNVVAGTNKSLIIQDSGIADTIEIASYSTSGGTRAIAMNGSVLTFGTGTAGGGSATPRLTINATGNLGIGTNSPVGKLDINAGGNTNIVISNDSVDTGYNIISLNGTRTKGSYAGIAGGGTGDNNLYLNSGNDVVVQTGASYSARMRITSAGLVRINTTSTLGGGYLGINGDIEFGGTAGGNYRITNYQAGFLAFGTDNTERMRITSEGYLYVGQIWNDSCHRITTSVAQGNNVIVIGGYNTSSNNSVVILAANGPDPNTAATVMRVTRNTSTTRSISASGTINASGADYAEYMTKAIEDNIAKGDIVGVNPNGLLTNIFADAKSFVVKSTDPSYVGGDNWGNEETLGEKKPIKTNEQTEEEYNVLLTEFQTKLEAERAKVDRIAFSGQVPCNVYNAKVGDYIIPIELEDGKITGQAVTNPSFEQYQIAVGKVWKIMEDGRAWIAVKIG